MLFRQVFQAALRVVLDDRDGFPTQAFDVIRGLLQVIWYCAGFF